MNVGDTACRVENVTGFLYTECGIKCKKTRQFLCNVIFIFCANHLFSENEKELFLREIDQQRLIKKNLLKMSSNIRFMY